MLQHGSFVDTQVPKAPLPCRENYIGYPWSSEYHKILCMMHKVNSTTATSYLLQFLSRIVKSHPKKNELFGLPKCKKIPKSSFRYHTKGRNNETSYLNIYDRRKTIRLSKISLQSICSANFAGNKTLISKTTTYWNRKSGQKPSHHH